jgi:TPP-dependent pyruvate/acetoin dehydrogenase alpha subunit
MDEKYIQAADEEVERLIDEAVEFAEKSPEPSADTVNEHVF